MYLVKTPKVIQNLFPNFLWRMPTQEKVMYLTFDDGPIPEVTPWVLEQLAQYDAKATFFCVGENAIRHPDVLQKVVEADHTIGNHTHSHLNGWLSDTMEYFHNIRQCAQLVKSKLFRPPYGRLTRSQAQFLQRHYEIVMWDVLSGDFDPEISREQCLQNVLGKARAGSIVVFHDSLKAQEKIKFVLPKVLAHFADLGYRFEAITEKVQASPAANNSLLMEQVA